MSKFRSIGSVLADVMRELEFGSEPAGKASEQGSLEQPVTGSTGIAARRRPGGAEPTRLPLNPLGGPESETKGKKARSHKGEASGPVTGQQASGGNGVLSYGGRMPFAVLVSTSFGRAAVTARLKGQAPVPAARPKLVVNNVGHPSSFPSLG